MIELWTHPGCGKLQGMIKKDQCCTFYIDICMFYSMNSIVPNTPTCMGAAGSKTWKEVESFSGLMMNLSPSVFKKNKVII